MIELKSSAEIEKIRESGRIVARAIKAMGEAAAPGVSTLQLDTIAAELVAKACATCSFLNYRGYPMSTCISVNDQVIHGIPSAETILKEGDVVDLDIGVCLDGWHADASWSYPIGLVSTDAQRLLSTTRECLMQGIAKAREGNRIGDIGTTVQRLAESNRYGVVRELVGHGIGRTLHEEPSVPNFGKPKTGPTLRAGMVFCIEPMINLGTYKVRTLSDGWTIVTADGKISAHFEHTIAVTKSGPTILTLE